MDLLVALLAKGSAPSVNWVGVVIVSAFFTAVFLGLRWIERRSDR